MMKELLRGLMLLVTAVLAVCVVLWAVVFTYVKCASSDELPTVPGVANPAVLCGSNLHCQWRVEAFAADVLLDIALDPDLIVGAAEAHGLRAIDLCLAAGECSENDAATMRACFQGACE